MWEVETGDEFLGVALLTRKTPPTASLASTLTLDALTHNIATTTTKRRISAYTSELVTVATTGLVPAVVIGVSIPIDGGCAAAVGSGRLNPDVSTASVLETRLGRDH
jgi:hypothetical protein